MRSKSGVVDHPGGLRDLSHEALDDSGVIEMSEYRELCVAVVAVAIPEEVELGAEAVGILLVVELLAGCEVAALVEIVFEPEATDREIAFVLPGKAQ